LQQQAREDKEMWEAKWKAQGELWATEEMRQQYRPNRIVQKSGTICIICQSAACGGWEDCIQQQQQQDQQEHQQQDQ